jgi:cystathionine beta-lyase/cystathionine gamma-synthase
MNDTPEQARQTTAITAGRAASGESLPPVLWPTSTFAVDSFAEARKRAATPRVKNFYGRFGNPGTQDFADAVAELEGAETALAFGSGMGALSTAVLALCSSGQHIVAQRQLFSSTTQLLRGACARFGIETTFVDGTDPQEWEAAVRPGKTALLVVETPSNPLLELVDLERIAAIKGPLKLVDSTFATPLSTRPLEIPGIDLVMHSATKALSGHNDATLGVLCGSDDLLMWIWGYHTIHGAVASPFDAWNALRGLRTLGIRVRQQCTTAMALAERLEAHDAIERVYYPGLASHPQRELAERQMDLSGGVLSFDLAGGQDQAERFVNRLNLVRIATSLGGPETIVTHPATTTHAVLSPEDRGELGIKDGLIRLSAGLEDTEDVIADLLRALSSDGLSTDAAPTDDLSTDE